LFIEEKSKNKMGNVASNSAGQTSKALPQHIEDQLIEMSPRENT